MPRLLDAATVAALTVGAVLGLDVRTTALDDPLARPAPLSDMAPRHPTPETPPGGARAGVPARAAAPPPVLEPSATGGSIAVPPTDTTPRIAPPAVRVRPPDQVPGRQTEPVWLVVPDLGVSAPVDPVPVQSSGKLGVPTDPTRIGWWADGARLVGTPQVLVGHVDTRTGPAVFAHLDRLRPGDLAFVVRGDGAQSAYRVTRVRRVAKSAFPTGEVYGPRSEPALQLITCTGTFDARRGHYQDNLVVTAAPAPDVTLQL